MLPPLAILTGIAEIVFVVPNCGDDDQGWEVAEFGALQALLGEPLMLIVFVLGTVE